MPSNIYRLYSIVHHLMSLSSCSCLLSIISHPHLLSFVSCASSLTLLLLSLASCSSYHHYIFFLYCPSCLVPCTSSVVRCLFLPCLLNLIYRPYYNIHQKSRVSQLLSMSLFLISHPFLFSLVSCPSSLAIVSFFLSRVHHLIYLSLVSCPSYPSYILSLVCHPSVLLFCLLYLVSCLSSLVLKLLSIILCSSSLVLSLFSLLTSTYSPSSFVLLSFVLLLILPK